MTEAHSEHTFSDCPPSPDDDVFQQKQEEAKRAKSSSSINSDVLSPITTPSDITSPVPLGNFETPLLGHSEQFFPSDPSLPTLISGASSVSADTEGDFLTNPGVIRSPGAMKVSGGTPDTLTPPSLPKEPSQEEQLPLEIDGDILPILADDDEDGYIADGDPTLKTGDDEDDSDSDEGLTMGRKKPAPPKRSGALVRRDTNASVGSTDTAKKVSMVE
jgi:[calcium/calmodulin-dependent protein kinase] kinase